MKSISNGRLRVIVDEEGGTLDSFFDIATGRELLWQGSPDSWTDKDVILFPFVGRLKDGYYTVDGKRYEMNIHGLCDYSTFQVAEHSQDSVTLRLTYDEATLARYPYKFDFSVARRLQGDTLVTTMTVSNVDDKTMYFGLGAHPALALPCVDNGDRDDLSGNYLDFGKEIEPYNLTLQDGKYILGREKWDKLSKLPLTKELMQRYPTIILTGADFSHFKLVRKDGASIIFDLGVTPNLGLWSWENKGGYYCIEPWLALPDYAEPERELSKKTGIIALEPNQKYVYRWSMTVGR